MKKAKQIREDGRIPKVRRNKEKEKRQKKGLDEASSFSYSMGSNQVTSKQIREDGRIPKVRRNKEKEKRQRKGLDEASSFSYSMKESNQVTSKPSKPHHRHWDLGQLELFVDLCWRRREHMVEVENKREWRKEDHVYIALWFTSLSGHYYSHRISKELWRWCEENYQVNSSPLLEKLKNVTKLKHLMNYAHDVNMTVEESERAYQQGSHKGINKNAGQQHYHDDADFVYSGLPSSNPGWPGQPIGVCWLFSAPPGASTTNVPFMNPVTNRFRV